MKKDMGGLRKYMPITFWTFMIGTLALAGIFPFAGFWSKDEILVTAGRSGYDAFLVVGLVGAFLTAAYMTRCVYLTFFGEYRGHGQPHESEPAITVPLIVLSVFAILAGVLAWSAWPFHLEKFKEWVEPRVSFPVVVHPGFDYSKAAISLAVATLGIGIAGYFWFKREELGALKDLTKRNKLAHSGYQFLINKYYLDALYENVIVAGDRGTDRHARRTGSTSTSSTQWSMAPPRAPRSSGSSRTRSSTRRASTARSTASPRSPARAAASCAICNPAASSATRCCSSPRSGS